MVRSPSFAILVAAAAAACASPRAAPEKVPLAPDPGPASARPVPPELAALGDAETARLMVELREQADLARIAARHARLGLGRRASRARTLVALESVAARATRRLDPLLEELASRDLVDDVRPLRFRARVVLTARAGAVAALRAHPDVAALIPEHDSLREAARRRGSAESRDDAPLPVPPGDSWALDALGALSAWREGVDGRGVLVGLLDSGADAAHAALAPGRAARASWHDPGGAYPEPADTAAHGSAVLACAVGRRAAGRALGVAPAARWAAALANEENGYNNVRMALAADWLLFEARPDVVLAPWGHGPGSCDARDLPLVVALRAAGAVPVFAAGNGGPGPGTGQAPAALSGLAPDGRGPLAVGAADRDGRALPSSARGPRPCGGPSPFPDVVAPGRHVPVPAPGGRERLAVSSGTSLAVGFAGGVAALVVQAAPDMPVPAVEDLLRRTARDLPPEGPDDATGFGLVDARAAVAAALEWSARRRRAARLAPGYGTFVSSMMPSSFLTRRGGGAGRARGGPFADSSVMPALLRTRFTKPRVSANGGMPP